MTKVKILSVLLLVLLMAVIPTACAGSTVITSTETSPTISLVPADKVDVIYFHGPSR